MQSYNPPLTRVDKEETRRYAGLSGVAAFPEQLLETACGDALLLARPRSVWNIYPYASATGIIAAPTPLHLSGDKIRRHLDGAKEAAVLAVTIGPALEEEVSRLFAAGEYTAGLLLDAAGTAAVEQAADAANHYIADQAARRGLKARNRFSPGYGDWAITDQPAVAALADGNHVALAVTPSCMLVPRKSVTALIGLAPATVREDNLCDSRGCASCPQANCIARRELS
ncbi:methionine synthase [Anaeroselena agilis]|uniref:Methionine synthase n=1 Tax=Anaeroselena agilis TaxID=3063788 RepID=A0ABU3P4C3_9FIRM|nr:methionine synthase [Selenomonadales bacterium 4137-cl]